MTITCWEELLHSQAVWLSRMFLWSWWLPGMFSPSCPHRTALVLTVLSFLFHFGGPDDAPGENEHVLRGSWASARGLLVCVGGVPMSPEAGSALPSCRGCQPHLWLTLACRLLSLLAQRPDSRTVCHLQVQYPRRRERASRAPLLGL